MFSSFLRYPCPPVKSPAHVPPIETDLPVLPADGTVGADQGPPTGRRVVGHLT